MSDYKYYYTQGEANFGHPLSEEVPGGSHLTFDVILHQRETLYALRRPDGLHDGPKNALYFPHGLIRFGESVTDCVGRLARDQAGVGISGTRLYTMPSWVDDNQHWHLCLNVLAEVVDTPRTSEEVSEVVPVGVDYQGNDFAWWTPEQLRDLLHFLGESVRAT